MTKRMWTVDIAGSTHVVELEHSWAWGHRVIRVDQQVVYRSGLHLWDTGSSHQIQIGDQTGTVKITMHGLIYRYDLTVDRPSVTTAEPEADDRTANDQPVTTAEPEADDRTANDQPVTTAELEADDRTANDQSVTTAEPAEERAPAPWWAWIFVLACVTVAALGGAIGALIGLAAARYCYRIAQNVERGLGARLLHSVGVTIGAWIGYMMLAMVVALLFGTR